MFYCMLNTSGNWLEDNIIVKEDKKLLTIDTFYVLAKEYKSLYETNKRISRGT